MLPRSIYLSRNPYPLSIFGISFQGISEAEDFVHELLVIAPAVEAAGRRKDTEGIREG